MGNKVTQEKRCKPYIYYIVTLLPLLLLYLYIVINTTKYSIYINREMRETTVTG